MNVQVKKLEKFKRGITVSVEGEEFLSDKKILCKDIGKKVKIPGFRPGKMPVEVLEQQHSELVKEEFIKKQLPVYYEKALIQENIKAVSMPNIKNVDITLSSITFTAEVDVRPEIEVKDSVYKNIKIKEKNPEVKDSEIEKVIESLKEGVKKSTGKDVDNEALARWAGYPNTGELKESIKAELYVEKLRSRRNKIDSQVGEHLLKSVNFDAPDSETEHYHKEMVNREMYNLQMRGVSQADLDKYRKDVEEKLKPVALQQVKMTYIVEAIAKNEGFSNEQNPAELVLGYILSNAKYE
ncbi:MAG: trigger factor [Candidatus Omnitrophota bacterium]